MQAGDDVALVSDAGTPGISDPGFRLVRASREAGIDVTVLPGPVAAVLALVGSGLPTDRWTFAGFLPSKTKARLEALETLRDGSATAVLYESPRRVVALLEAVRDIYGEVDVCVARELTKMHEEWLVGPVSRVCSDLEARDAVRGEIVVVIAPGEDRGAQDDVDEWIAAMIDGGLRPSEIKTIASNATGLSKSEIWDRMERLKSG
jgi:16S rRNA (cytidine1402-2'-O)-methyltransferase